MVPVSELTGTIVVEMGRIELPSDDAKPKTSPGAVC